MTPISAIGAAIRIEVSIRSNNTNSGHGENPGLSTPSRSSSCSSEYSIETPSSEFFDDTSIMLARDDDHLLENLIPEPCNYHGTDPEKTPHITPHISLPYDDDGATSETDLAHTWSNRAELPQVSDLTDQLTRISQFPVAHGGFSDIYQADWIYRTDWKDGVVHNSTHKVAVKLLRVFTRLEWDRSRALKRLAREVMVWQRLEHPNIAKFYGVSYQMGDRPSLVMQWYRNGTAVSYLKGKQKEVKLSMIKDIAGGLVYLHGLQPRIVHGDLKGNNVLVTDDKRAVLSDFGLSKILEDLGPTGTTTATIAGSVRWQAPEQITINEEDDTYGVSKPKPPIDVWAFGCTAYELLTGNIPYLHRRSDYQVILDVIRGGSPVHPDDDEVFRASPIGALLRLCWILDPDKRPSMKEIFSMLL